MSEPRYQIAVWKKGKEDPYFSFGCIKDGDCVFAGHGYSTVDLIADQAVKFRYPFPDNKDLVAEPVNMIPGSYSHSDSYELSDDEMGKVLDVVKEAA